MVDGERDKYDNDEHVYYLIIGIAPVISQGWNGGWGWVVEW